MVAAMADSSSQTDSIPDDLTFEDALRELEAVVRQLESGDVPLEQSITLYERGEKLRTLCQKRLDAAQMRIEQIVAGPDGAPAGTKPLDQQG